LTGVTDFDLLTVMTQNIYFCGAGVLTIHWYAGFYFLHELDNKVVCVRCKLLVDRSTRVSVCLDMPASTVNRT